MKNLLYREFLIQNRVYNLIKYSILFFSFCLLSISFINSPEEIEKFGPLFAVLYIPLGFLGISQNLINHDYNDGSLEQLLITTTPIKIILAKFLILNFNTILSFLIVSPFIQLFFNINLNKLVILITSAVLLISISSSLLIFISSIQSYFKSNTYFLSILVMPLIIPNIILSGLSIQNPTEPHLLNIMLGIDFIIIPPVLYLSSYLIDNIYNI